MIDLKLNPGETFTLPWRVLVSDGERSKTICRDLIKITASFPTSLAVVYPDGDPADGDCLITATIYMGREERAKFKWREACKELFRRKTR